MSFQPIDKSRFISINLADKRTVEKWATEARVSVGDAINFNGAMRCAARDALEAAFDEHVKNLKSGKKTRTPDWKELQKAAVLSRAARIPKLL